MQVNRLDKFIELERDLTVLKRHYELCHDANAKEVLEWARFFIQWSKKAADQNFSWAMANLVRAEKLAKTLDKPPAGFNPFEALQVVLDETHQAITREIIKFTETKTILPALEQLISR